MEIHVKNHINAQYDGEKFIFEKLKNRIGF